MPVRNCAHGITQRTFIGSYIAQSTTSQRQRQKEQQHLRDGDDGGHNQTGNYAVAYRKAFLHNRKTVVGVKRMGSDPEKPAQRCVSCMVRTFAVNIVLKLGHRFRRRVYAGGKQSVQKHRTLRGLP